MIEAVLTRLRAGERLHQQIVDGRRQWWFDEPFEDVPDAVVVRIRATGEFALKEAGDSLFGLPENSQTWGGVDVSDRIPCINPRCRRTAAQDKFPDSHEIICGKCFRALPAAFRAEHRRCWREINKLERRILRTADPLKAQRMRDICNEWVDRLNVGWAEIRQSIEQPDKPAGLETFLEEIGL